MIFQQNLCRVNAINHLAGVDPPARDFLSRRHHNIIKKGGYDELLILSFIERITGLSLFIA